MKVPEIKLHNCTCGAYTFPHRPLSGGCDGKKAFDTIFMFGFECQGCPYHVVTVLGKGPVTRRECSASHPKYCRGIKRMIGEHK